MRSALISFILTAILICPAFAQVDTLELVEINSLEISDPINELYIEDLDGDQFKEIILTTDLFRRIKKELDHRRWKLRVFI